MFLNGAAWQKDAAPPKGGTASLIGLIQPLFFVVLLTDNVVVGLKDIACPVAPMVQRIGFGDQTVFPHYLPHAAIRLEDACAQEDMGKGENEHDTEEQVVEEQ